MSGRAPERRHGALRAAAIALAGLAAGPAVAAGTLLPSYALVAAPSLVRHTSGPDGLVGSADDVLLVLPGPDAQPGTLDDVPANRFGAASSLQFTSLPFGGDFETFASGGIVVKSMAVQAGAIVIGAFDLVATTDATDGLDGTLTDADLASQSIQIAPTGEATATLRLHACTGGPTSCLDVDVALAGAALRPGMSAASIPGVSASFAAAIDAWTALLPSGWTQLLALRWAPTLLSPLNASGDVAPFFWSGTGAGTIVAVSSDPGLLDGDADGVPDGLDNCPFAANADQLDSGGIGATSTADGIGDACQCGDASGDGRVSTADAIVIQRALLVPPTAAMAHPERCDVAGSASCTNADAIVIRRALLVPPTATITQSCAPAHL